jgi:hypothetical protein
MTTPLKRSVLSALVLGALAATGPTTRGDEPRTLTLAVAGRSNEHAAVASSGAFVAVVWAATTKDGPTDIYLATSADAGASLSAPVRVNHVEGQARVNGEQPPRVALVPRGSGTPDIHVVWTNRAAEGTRLMAARSIDGGKTFTPATVVAGSAAVGSRGWHSLAVAHGKVYALWLDHRDTDSAKNGVGSSGAHVHNHAGAAAPRRSASVKSDGVAKARQSQLFVTALDGTLGARGLERGVCYCCRTAFVSGGDGTLYAAWRHVYEGDQRDIAFTLSNDGARTFSPAVRISQDDWQIDGCPENGPALAVDGTRTVHVAWPTLVDEQGRESLRVFYASSRGGKTFTKRTMISRGRGHAYHPSIAVTPAGAPLVAWEETDPGGRRVKLARGALQASGATEDIGLGVYPQLVSTPRHALLAWTSHQPNKPPTIAVRRLNY